MCAGGRGQEALCSLISILHSLVYQSNWLLRILVIFTGVQTCAQGPSNPWAKGSGMRGKGRSDGINQFLTSIWNVV